jgi:hypothetical protein
MPRPKSVVVSMEITTVGRAHDCMSHRDFAVHKGIVSIDTMIDDADRGRFVITLDKETVAPACSWLEAAFHHVHQFIFALRDQIRDADAVTTAEV